MIALLRIDDKLIHAQTIWGWVRVLGSSSIVVANDEAAHDELRRKLLTMAGAHLNVRVLSLEEAARYLMCHEERQEKSIVVVSKPADVVYLIENGVPVKSVNVGWMSFFPGKKRILETVSVDEKDIEAFRKLIGEGIVVKYQASPSDVQLDMADYI
jgi:mannose/fructose/N-acetylgalactosamine-specific phosphotransferase system component IIB